MVVNRCMEIIDKRFLFVGITELFCESLFVYSVLIGAERPPLWRHLGRSFAPCPSDLSQSILEQLEYKTRIDAAIYHAAKLRFESRYAAEIEHFRSQIKSLRA